MRVISNNSSNENVAVSLVTQPLVRDNNYLNWRKSMEMALGIKMKLGFVRGEFPRPVDVYQEIGSSLIHVTDCMHAWEDLEEHFSGSNDFTVFSIQHEISMLMQEDNSIAQYYNKLIQLWGDEDALTVETACELGSRCKARRCSNDRKMRDRRMKFLMGLNEVYLTSRSNILQMMPSPSLKECYKQLIQDENQRKSKKAAVTEMSALYAGQSPGGSSQAFRFSQANYQSFGGDNANSRQGGRSSDRSVSTNRPRKPPLFCTHCQLQGHVKETYYKLHGYPMDISSITTGQLVMVTETIELIANYIRSVEQADAPSGRWWS
ncbi:hypothetical protein QQ045_000309 [Rhodiola kirilowii]